MSSVVSDPLDTETIATLLADDGARTILVATKEEPRSAAELSERAAVSEPTVYRRLERLREHDLVVERIEPVTDGKNYKTYQARLDGVDIDLPPRGSPPRSVVANRWPTASPGLFPRCEYVCTHRSAPVRPRDAADRPTGQRRTQRGVGACD